MPETYPASLPQKHFRGVTEERQTATLRSQMDTGAPKVRKQFTAAVRNIDIPMVFTAAQRATFDTFFITTLNEGASSFTWVDPVDDSTNITYRFKKPPKMTKVAGEWKCVFNLEVLP